MWFINSSKASDISTLEDILNYAHHTGGYIMSVDTLNTRHIGPKLQAHMVAIDPAYYEEWLSFWGHNGTYTWGADEANDHEAFEALFNAASAATDEACNRLGLSVIWGFFPDDGAVLGWHRWDAED